MHSSGPANIPANFMFLEKNEIDFLKKIEAIIVEGEEDQLTILVTNLPKLKSLIIFCFAETSPIFLAYLRNQTDLMNEWSKRLKKENYLSFQLHSLSGEDKLSVIDLLCGAAAFSFYSKSSNLDLESLAKACQLNNYQALIARCDRNIKALGENKLNEIQQDQAILQLTQDTTALSNFYWEIGYFKSGEIFYQLHSEFSKKSDFALENNDPDLATDYAYRAKHFLELAIKNYLTVELLSTSLISEQDRKLSTEIVAFLTNGVGLISPEGDFNFKSWTDAKIEFKEMLKETYGVVEHRALQDLKEKLNPKEKKQLIRKAASHPKVKEMDILTTSLHSISAVSSTGIFNTAIETEEKKSEFKQSTSKISTTLKKPNQ